MAFLVASLPIVGCSSFTPRIIPLLKEAGIPFTPTPPVPLEVVTRSTSVKDPLPVRGTEIVYGDVEAALGYAVSVATVPWAESHRTQRPEGWQLMVELIDADAQQELGGRLVVTLNVRATLRTRVGNGYLAQTQAACTQSGPVSADRGAPVLYNCMTRVGRDLSNWLSGVEP